jgi:hypothetical protein
MAVIRLLAFANAPLLYDIVPELFVDERNQPAIPLPLYVFACTLIWDMAHQCS